jgi:hypothetical protein
VFLCMPCPAMMAVSSSSESTLGDCLIRLSVSMPWPFSMPSPPSASLLEEVISDSLQRPYPTDKAPPPFVRDMREMGLQIEPVDGRWGSE